MPNNEYKWRIGDLPPTIKPHSIAKQKVYEEYIDKYIHTFNKNPMVPNFKMVIVDGFAGGGAYIDVNGKPHEGSPVKVFQSVINAEKAIDKNRKNKFTVQAKFFFIEKKLTNFNYLKQHLTDLEYDKYFDEKIFIQQGSFEDTYEKIIKSIRQDFTEGIRAIFILDQYGWTNVPTHIIRKIFQELPNAEIILTISVDHLIDYICNPEEFIEAESQIELFGSAHKQKKIEQGIKIKQAARDAFQNTLELDLKDLHDTKEEHPQVWRAIIEQKLTEKLQLASGAKYYTPFFLSEEGRHRDMWLVHLSNHSEARNVMTQVHWSVSTHKEIKMQHYGSIGLDMLGYNAKYDDSVNNSLSSSFTDFSFNKEDESNMKLKIIEELPRKLHNNPITWRELYSQCANYTPAHKGQMKDVAQELLQLNELSVIGKDGEIRRTDIKDDDIIQIPPQLNLNFDTPTNTN